MRPRGYGIRETTGKTRGFKPEDLPEGINPEDIVFISNHRKIEPQIPNSSPYLAAALEEAVMKQGALSPRYTIKELHQDSCVYRLYKGWMEDNRIGLFPRGHTIYPDRLVTQMIHS